MREKTPGAPGAPYCCWLDCERDAEYEIHGDSGLPDDDTQACEAHVGALLGTPVAATALNRSWRVYVLDPTPSAREVTGG